MNIKLHPKSNNDINPPIKAISGINVIKKKKDN